MSNYGRNFEFRVSPRPNNRAGRYKNSAPVIPIGSPVAVAAGATLDADGRLAFALATAAVAPVKGIHGIAVYEYAFAAYAGKDPFLTTPSDLDVVPADAPCQLVSGDDVKVVFRNTVAGPFMGRQYPGRTMIAGLGATPTLAVGDFIGPGPGTDAGGYWSETAAGTAWFVVVGIDINRAEVEARMTF